MRTSLSLWALLGAALTPAALAAQGDSTVLTFEEFTTTGPGTGGQARLTDQYPGVRFNSAWILDYSQGIPIPRFAHSGTRAIVLCYAVEFCGDTTFQLRFRQPQQRVRVWVGLSRSPEQSVVVTMIGLDAAGRPVVRDRAVIAAAARPRIETTLEARTDSNRIVAVTVAAQPGAGSDFALDDVVFQRAAPTPPPPPPPPPPQQRRVPDVTGQTLEEAGRILGDSGFRIGARQWVRERGPAGTVWRQRPPPGTPAPAGAPVNLFLVLWVTVPDVIGLPRDQADRLLADSGFVAAGGGEVRDALPVGSVGAQRPAAGASAPLGDVVTLDVVIGPPLPPDDGWPRWLIVVGVLIAAAATVMTVRGRRGQKRPPRRGPVTARLASNGLDRQDTSMDEPKPFDLEIRVSPRPDASGTVEYEEDT